MQIQGRWRHYVLKILLIHFPLVLFRLKKMVKILDHLLKSHRITILLMLVFTALNLALINLVETNEYLDMPDLLMRARDQGHSISVCHLHERWIDVGRPESLRLANS